MLVAKKPPTTTTTSNIVDGKFIVKVSSSETKNTEKSVDLETIPSLIDLKFLKQAIEMSTLTKDNEEEEQEQEATLKKVKKNTTVTLDQDAEAEKAILAWSMDTRIDPSPKEKAMLILFFKHLKK